MIVISTNNGHVWLPKLIDSIARLGPLQEKYLIVDTQSDNPEFVKYLHSLPDKVPFDLTITRTPYRGFDTGAIVWAHREFRQPEYVFLHDSLEIKESGWLKAFREAYQSPHSVVAWQLFDYAWYNDKETADWVMEKIGVNDHRKKGIFGPIFYTTQVTMDLFESKKLLEAIPTRKEEAMAMELGWVAICYAAGVPLLELEPHVWEKVKADRYRWFRKNFGSRR